MALRDIYIGSMGALLYDDDFFDAASFDGTVKVSEKPVAATDVVRKEDVPALVGGGIKFNEPPPTTADLLPGYGTFRYVAGVLIVYYNNAGVIETIQLGIFGV